MNQEMDIVYQEQMDYGARDAILADLGGRPVTAVRSTLISLSSNDLFFNAQLLDKALDYKISQALENEQNLAFTPAQKQIIARQTQFFNDAKVFDIPNDIPMYSHTPWSDCLLFAFGDRTRQQVTPRDVTRYIRALKLKNPVQCRFAALVFSCAGYCRWLDRVGVREQERILKDLLLVIMNTWMDHVWFETHYEVSPLGYINNISLVQWYFVCTHLQRWTYFWEFDFKSSYNTSLLKRHFTDDVPLFKPLHVQRIGREDEGVEGDSSGAQTSEVMDVDKPEASATATHRGTTQSTETERPVTLRDLQNEYIRARDRFFKAKDMIENPQKVVADPNTVVDLTGGEDAVVLKK